MSSRRPNCGETMTTGARASKPRALVVRRHHLLVRISHWLTIPLLLGLIVSGISIYWASPIYQHDPNPTTGSFDYFADAGIWICAHIPWLHHYADPANWVYNHGSLGPYMLAFALRFHWLCAYLFMLNGLVYLAGLCIGGGWRSLLPRSSDSRGVLQMARYYLGLPYTILARRRPIHPSCAGPGQNPAVVRRHPPEPLGGDHTSKRSGPLTADLTAARQIRLDEVGEVQCEPVRCTVRRADDGEPSHRALMVMLVPGPFR